MLALHASKGRSSRKWEGVGGYVLLSQPTPTVYTSTPRKLTGASGGTQGTTAGGSASCEQWGGAEQESMAGSGELEQWLSEWGWGLVGTGADSALWGRVLLLHGAPLG